MSKDSAPEGQELVFLDGTKMRVRERLGDSLKGVHIVRKGADGNLETTDAETGQISTGTDSQIVRIVLHDAHVDLGPKGRFAVAQLSMDLIKEENKNSLKKIASDLRRAKGEPDGPANGSQPIRSEANRTSSAAGSRR
jgi:hypothetical protein